MDSIILTKDSEFVVNHWGGDSYEKRELDNFFFYKDSPLTLEDGVTLGDFFKAIKRTLLDIEEEDVDILEAMLGNTNLYLFNNEIEKEPTDPVNNIKFIEVSKTLRIIDDESELEDYLDVAGIGNNGDLYGIELTPLNNLKHILLKLNEKGHMYLQSGIIEFNYVFPFLDTVLAILNEISFFGNPEDRDRQFKELNERVKEIEEGKAKLIPWEEIKKDLDKNS